MLPYVQCICANLLMPSLLDLATLFQVAASSIVSFLQVLTGCPSLKHITRSLVLRPGAGLMAGQQGRSML